MNQPATKTRPHFTSAVAATADAGPLTVRQVGRTMGAEVIGMPIHGDVSP